MVFKTDFPCIKSSDPPTTGSTTPPSIFKLEVLLHHILSGLETLTAGAAFWRGAGSTEGEEVEWEARRSISAADWKSKRRAALKHTASRNSKTRKGARA